MTPPVYVAFTMSTHWFSKVIVLFTGGKVSHSELVFYSPDFGGWVVLGAQTGGFIMTPFEYREEAYITVIKLPRYDLWTGIKKNRIWFGAKYDLRALFGMAWVTVYWRLFKKWVANPGDTKKSWFCSEIIRQILTDSNVPLTLDMYQASTSPESLRQAMYQIPGVIVFESPTRAQIYEDAGQPMP